MSAILLISSTAGVLSRSDPSAAIEKDTESSTRTVYGITWGCLTTIFACTWLAIHPNIPSPNDSRFRILMRRAMIMGVAILVPEYTTVWAFRQWRTARLVRKAMSYRSEWTISHSFFLTMGGFMLVDGKGQRVRPLLVDDVLQSTALKLNAAISLPTISEKEIQDRSKGDALSKTLILFQTTWFLVQVLARVVLRLPITELELITVAFASLNVLAYAFWYNKPLNVDCAIPVLLLDDSFLDSNSHRYQSEISSIHFLENPIYRSQSASTTSLVSLGFPDPAQSVILNPPPPVYNPGSRLSSTLPFPTKATPDSDLDVEDAERNDTTASPAEETDASNRTPSSLVFKAPSTCSSLHTPLHNLPSPELRPALRPPSPMPIPVATQIGGNSDLRAGEDVEQNGKPRPFISLFHEP
ncbi:hypothetical protein D9758_008199 [Tetrapyrgos nigripes]|uniref:Uncharacterized protein n=1 Tax=Tetrapyrgos nigripes TaxID=182062 RepID=A0A8H5G1F9_9AGAR|nr:hypothetical protein D9758_008199 [Tetrapyrgos nigripes]